MKYIVTIHLVALLALIATGCMVDTTDEDQVEDEDLVDDQDSEDLDSIPDPGTDYAPYRWYDDGGYHGTPQTAQVMGPHRHSNRKPAVRICFIAGISGRGP